MASFRQDAPSSGGRRWNTSSPARSSGKNNRAPSGSTTSVTPGMVPLQPVRPVTGKKHVVSSPHHQRRYAQLPERRLGRQLVARVARGDPALELACRFGRAKERLKERRNQLFAQRLGMLVATAEDHLASQCGAARDQPRHGREHADTRQEHTGLERRGRHVVVHLAIGERWVGFAWAWRRSASPAVCPRTWWICSRTWCWRR